MGFSEKRRIEWGDCDDAGVVFYPSYFRWMDGTFHAMCAAAGHDQRSLRSELGVFGTPLIDARATFRAPATFGQIFEVEVDVSRWGRTNVSLAYRFSCEGLVILEGEEARVFVRHEDGGRLIKTPVPEPFRDAVSTL